ncbi:MAG: hypothetical protein JXR61_02125 [Prolixibacteraceae bacterium]|nr:hypothetical protein [Prolixibacteraceae bacterium]
MALKLKRDQLPKPKAENWKENLKEEEKLSMNLKLSPIILQKETYKILAGENENRLRIYLGLEPVKKEGKYELCAYAVSSFLLGSGDVYVDYETPVFKLEKQNFNVSDKINDVLESIKMYRKWRLGELDSEHQGADYRQYIYPNAFLMTKYELHELFNVQNASELKVEFGISKTMSPMISTVKPHGESVHDEENKMIESNEDAPFDFMDPCPPFCDERSIFNP